MITNILYTLHIRPSSIRRSCIINITRVKNINISAKPTTTRQHHLNPFTPNKKNVAQLSSSTLPRTSIDKTNYVLKKPKDPIKQKELATVIYVESRHAKAVKNELELHGLLDKRYKMIPVGGNNNEIAIPIIVNPHTNIDQMIVAGINNDDINDGTSIRFSMNFRQWVMRSGTEMVPFSSSSMGKMKNKSSK